MNNPTELPVWQALIAHQQQIFPLHMRDMFAQDENRFAKFSLTVDDLLLDYQHGLIYWLLVPVQDASDGSRKEYWRPKMQCLVHAFQDWNCEALLVRE